MDYYSSCNRYSLSVREREEWKPEESPGNRSLVSQMLLMIPLGLISLSTWHESFFLRHLPRAAWGLLVDTGIKELRPCGCLTPSNEAGVVLEIPISSPLRRQLWDLFYTVSQSSSGLKPQFPTVTACSGQLFFIGFFSFQDIYSLHSELPGITS